MQEKEMTDLFWVNEYYRIKLLTMGIVPACLLLGMLIGVVINTFQTIYRRVQYFVRTIPRYVLLEYKEKWGQSFWYPVDESLHFKHFTFRGEEWYRQQSPGTKAIAKFTMGSYAQNNLDDFEPFTNSLSQRMRLKIGDLLGR